MPDYCLPVTWITCIAFTVHGVCLSQTVDAQEPHKRRINGVIVDESGTPVVNAVVRVGGYQSKRLTRTDQGGRFSVDVPTHGRGDLFITAEGKAPLFERVGSGDTPNEVRIRIQDAKKLKLRIVDRQGNPIPDAGVSVHYAGRWWPLTRARSKEDGRVVWHGAPAEVTCEVWKDGFATLKTDVSANNSEHQLTLYPSLRFSGSVTDKQTGEPIEHFTVIPVREFEDGHLTVDRHDAAEYTGGEYVIDCEDMDQSYRVRIEARGYRTAVSDGAYRAGDPNPVCDFQLHRASPVTGRVVDDGSEPVSGARVYLATASQPLKLFNHKDDLGYFIFYVDADAEGRFEFPSQIEPYGLVIVHELGYGETTLRPDQQPGQIVIKPWGRIEGTLFQSGQPVPSARVDLLRIRSQSGAAPRIDDSFTTTTDELGKYQFPRVPPARCQLKAQLWLWREYPITSSQSVPLDIRPGQRLLVNLGRDGAEVIGRVVLTGKVPPQFQFSYSINYLVCKKPGIEPPSEIADLASKEFSWRDGWSDSWLKTPEGRLYRQTLHHHFVKLAPDGSFRISGVREGEHDLMLNVYEPPEGCLGNPIATGLVPIQITESDVKNGSLDLGEIELDPSFGPQLGELVPNLQFETAANDVARLSHFRGKYVLLDFWATWCVPCVAKLADVQRLHEMYGRRGQLVVLGMSLDKDKNEARQFVKERSLDWDQGFLGDWSETPIPTQLGISSVPTYVLIDPQGRLVFKSCFADQMSQKISELLDGDK